MRIILLLSACFTYIVPLEDDEFPGNFRSTKSPLFLKNWFIAATKLSAGKRGVTKLQPNPNLAWMSSTYPIYKGFTNFANLSLIHNCGIGNTRTYLSSTNFEDNPAWAVDLEINYFVINVIVNARHNEKASRFRKVYLIVTEEKPHLQSVPFYQNCSYFAGPAAARQRINFPCNEWGRYITIAIKEDSDKAALEMCGVSIFAEMNIKIDGKWGSWNAWDYCSRSCGGGIKKRWRFCNNPPPQYGGEKCQGDSAETRNCDNNPCKIRMQLENLDERRLFNDTSFDNGDVVQCSPSENPGIMKYVWISVRCGNLATAFSENCTEGELPCQINLYSLNPFSTCTLSCDGIHRENGDIKYKVISHTISIRHDNKIRLTLEEVEEVNSINGNIRESDYRVVCVPNRIDHIKYLYIKQECVGLKTDTEYCDRSNCEITISVDKITYCNISCHADLYDNNHLKDLSNNRKMVCITPQWNEWSECTETCGKGWQTRERSCIRSDYPEADSDLPCYEADSRECVTDKICDVPNNDPPLYFKPRKPRTATIQYIWDITPPDVPP